MMRQDRQLETAQEQQDGRANAGGRRGPLGMVRRLRWLLAALLVVTAPYGDAQDAYNGHGQVKADRVEPGSCNAPYESESVHDLVIPRTRPLGLRLTELDPGKPGVHAVAVQGVASEAAVEAFMDLPLNHMVMQVRKRGHNLAAHPSSPTGPRPPTRPPRPPPKCESTPKAAGRGTPYAGVLKRRPFHLVECR